MGKEVINPLVKEITNRINSREIRIGKKKAELIDDAIEQGRDLIALKEALPHGSFMSYCDENVYVARQQRQNYITVAKAPLEMVEEYKASSDITHGIIGLVNKASGKEANYHLSGNLERGQPLEATDGAAREEEKKPLKDLINEELSSFRIQDDDEGVNLFDWSHSLMAKVISLSKDDNLKKMKPSEFADLLYEAITYSDWGEPVHASSIRDDIKMLRHFFDFGQQAMQYIQQPTAQEVRNA